MHSSTSPLALVDEYAIRYSINVFSDHSIYKIEITDGVNNVSFLLFKVVSRQPSIVISTTQRLS
jgi:hypothetical protein